MRTTNMRGYSRRSTTACILRHDITKLSLAELIRAQIRERITSMAYKEWNETSLHFVQPFNHFLQSQHRHRFQNNSSAPVILPLHIPAWPRIVPFLSKSLLFTQATMPITMSLAKTASLAMVIALTCASPLQRAPTRILPRELPKPSAYPGDEGACEHEWQYLNFNKDDNNDKQRLEKLHHTICSGEMRALTSYGSGAASRLLAPYTRFFPQNDEEDNYDDLQGHIVKVLDLITGTSSTDGAIGSIVGSFVVDNLGKFDCEDKIPATNGTADTSTDFGGRYPEDANKEDCSIPGTLAYTAFDDGDDGIEADGLEKIHFCQIAYDVVQFEKVVADCAALDAYPSEKMDTFSRIALHEMTHMSTIGPPIIGDEDEDGQIKDIMLTDPDDDEDRFAAYGPVNAHALVDESQDDYFNPAVTEINADSYAWMALDALVSRHCATDATDDNWQNFFTENPPAI